jgi:hypothetical protein
VALMKTNGTADGMAAMSARAKDAATQVVPLAQQAGTTAVQGVQTAVEWAAPRAADAVQTAKVWAAPRAQDAVRGAREWAAPRLEDVADAVDTSVAPTVSSALRTTAKQVRPAPPAKRGLLNWRVLLGIGAAVAAASAAAAVAMRRRYASATAEAEDATTQDVPDPESADGSAAHAEVNGRVATPGS